MSKIYFYMLLAICIKLVCHVFAQFSITAYQNLIISTFVPLYLVNYFVSFFDTGSFSFLCNKIIYLFLSSITPKVEVYLKVYVPKYSRNKDKM